MVTLLRIFSFGNPRTAAGIGEESGVRRLFYFNAEDAEDTARLRRNQSEGTASFVVDEWGKHPRSKLRGIGVGTRVAGVADPGPASPRPATSKPEQAPGYRTQRE